MSAKILLDATIGDLVLCLSDAVDLINPVVGGHNGRVAKYAIQIAKQMGCSSKMMKNVWQAALVHDLGGMALTLDEKKDLLDLDVSALPPRRFDKNKAFHAAISISC